ncbi:hypothetical protein CDL15_Pgr020974 [Punica granatum]|uniref:Reverse transcriptase zinc-binding domain-containing protein n=1 Tax=Punica granatum TaxID=22663 RepID=A0A218Y1H6_PUNGR|nr:hypothetical protein CDL15_Pgr020974 [Punica granatum]
MSSTARLAANDVPLLNGRSLFVLAEMWKDICPSRSRVEWHKLIWFFGHVPRASFICWLALLDRLTTTDMLKKWGHLVTDGCCCFCQMEEENRSHLSFTCSFTKSIWEKIRNILFLAGPTGDWDKEYNEALEWKGKKLETIIKKLAWTVYIYIVWSERNVRIFQGRAKSAEVLTCSEDFVQFFY